MEIIKGIKKNTILILSITLVILYFVLKDDLSGIIKTMKGINYFYIIIAVIFYFLSLIIKGYVLYESTNDKSRLSLKEAIKHNIITQFFNGITPFSSGGQPMEIYMLTEHGIPLSKATSIIIQNFIFYQTALVLFGTLAVLYNAIFHIFPSVPVLRRLVLLGFSVNIVVIIVLYMVILSKKQIKKVAKMIIHILSKLNIIKNENEKLLACYEKLDDFHKHAFEITKHKSLLVKYVILNFIGLACFYIVPLFIAFALNNFTGLNVANTLTTSAYILIMGAFVPAPGASGGIEYGFIKFFGNFLPKLVVNATLLIWRFITYYLGMIVGAILFVFEKKEK